MCLTLMYPLVTQAVLARWERRIGATVTCRAKVAARRRRLLARPFDRSRMSSHTFSLPDNSALIHSGLRSTRHKTTMPSHTAILPPAYYYFFFLVEPVCCFPRKLQACTHAS